MKDILLEGEVNEVVHLGESLDSQVLHLLRVHATVAKAQVVETCHPERRCAFVLVF